MTVKSPAPSRPILSCPVSSRRVTFHPAPPCPVLSRHITSHPITSRHVTPYHILSRPVPSCPVLSLHKPSMSSPVVDISSRIDDSTPSIALDAVLSTLCRQACTNPLTSSSSSARVTQGSSANIDTGVHLGDGAALHTSLLNLIDRRVS